MSRPALVGSLLLVAPGGSLVAEVTPDLGAYIGAERAALSRGDVDEQELDPPVLERLGEAQAPTLVLVGELDLEAVHDSARRLVAGVPGARRVGRPDAAHLPSLEHPERFLALLRDWSPPSGSTSSP